MSKRTRRVPGPIHKTYAQNFTVRLRGLDQDEVRYCLAGLADDLEGLQAQVATLTLENDSLRAELSEPPADAMDQVTDQAVSVLNQAQQLADSLIDEAMQSARDLLLTARSQQRDIMEQAKVAAKGAVNRATAIAERAGSETPRSATSVHSDVRQNWRRCVKPCSMLSTACQPARGHPSPQTDSGQRL
jgi:cell division initiation protein